MKIERDIIKQFVEWKKAENCISGRSIVVYNDRFHPKHRIRFSFLNLQYNCGMLACPSPLAEWIWKWLPQL